MSECTHVKSAKAKRCRSCAAKWMNSNPEIHAKRLQGIADHYADPKNLAKARERTRALNARLMQDPAHIEKLRANGKYLQAALQRPEIRARIYGPEACAKRGKAIREVRLAGIPEAYRAEYAHLVRFKRVPAAEARVIIMDQVARDNDPIKVLDRFYGGKPARAA